MLLDVSPEVGLAGSDTLVGRHINTVGVDWVILVPECHLQHGKNRIHSQDVRSTDRLK